MSKKDAPDTTPSTNSGGVAAFVRSRRGLLIIAAVALVSLAGAAFALSGSVDGDESTPAKATATASNSSDATSTAQSGATTAVPSPPSATPRPDGAPRPNGGKAPDGRQGAPSRLRGPVPLAPAGSRLASVTSAPPKTLNRIKMPEGVKTAQYVVSFEPYGWAPDGPEGRRMVVMISSAQSRSDAMPDIAGKNLLLAMASYKGEQLDKGGKFEGTVEVRPDSEGRGAFFLIDSQPAR